MKFLPRFLLAAGCLLTLGAGAFSATPLTQLLSEAQTAYLRGDLDGARAKFESARSMDPKNQTATAYLRIIEARRAEAPGLTQEKQLAKLVIPKVDFREATLSSALDYVAKTVEKLSDGKVMVNFVLQMPEELKAKTVTLNLKSIPATELLKYISELTGTNCTYDRYAITVRPNAAAAAEAQTATPPNG